MIKLSLIGLIISPSSPYLTIYPNPASDNLMIDFDPEHVEQVRSNRQNINYEFRLYNNQGNLLRQAKTKSDNVQFNVSNLPYGIYYLHIYDGINSTPEIQQIIIER